MHATISGIRNNYLAVDKYLPPNRKQNESTGIIFHIVAGSQTSKTRIFQKSVVFNIGFPNSSISITLEPVTNANYLVPHIPTQSLGSESQQPVLTSPPGDSDALKFENHCPKLSAAEQFHLVVTLWR